MRGVKQKGTQKLTLEGVETGLVCFGRIGLFYVLKKELAIEVSCAAKNGKVNRYKVFRSFLEIT